MIYLSQKGTLFSWDKDSQIAKTQDGKLYKLSEEQVGQCDVVANAPEQLLDCFVRYNILESFVERKALGEGDVLLIQEMVREIKDV